MAFAATLQPSKDNKVAKISLGLASFVTRVTLVFFSSFGGFLLSQLTTVMIAETLLWEESGLSNIKRKEEYENEYMATHMQRPSGWSLLSLLSPPGSHLFVRGPV